MLSSTSAVNPVLSGDQPTDVSPISGGERVDLHLQDTDSSVIFFSKSGEGIDQYFENKLTGSPISNPDQQQITSTPTTMDMETEDIGKHAVTAASVGLISSQHFSQFILARENEGEFADPS